MASDDDHPAVQLGDAIPDPAWRDDATLRGALEHAVQVALDRPPVALRLLESARACVLDRGVARVTMSDVARRADVSRTTLYRHYPDVEAVLRDLMTHDFGRLAIEAVTVAVDRPNGRERLVATVAEVVRALRGDALFRKILDVDPEHLLPYLTARPGASQRTMLELLEAAIAAGRADGSIAAGDGAVRARVVLLQLQAVTVSAGVVADDEAAEAALVDAVAIALDAQLRVPIAGS
ncbi:TetR/AcrR family transcriptional regulator [Patulibacter defluvii]|uniref:TetR/AcrR family transcriptional regulator n=1 Tax=Patulibacter defluvii TaxID=3095358 RepID=UPI002A74A8AB|nr:TetR/AcrR family transcriptional regulator [Patulibacter sp. DM4]